MNRRKIDHHSRGRELSYRVGGVRCKNFRYDLSQNKVKFILRPNPRISTRLLTSVFAIKELKICCLRILSKHLGLNPGMFLQKAYRIPRIIMPRKSGKVSERLNGEVPPPPDLNQITRLLTKQRKLKRDLIIFIRLRKLCLTLVEISLPRRIT